MGLTSCLGQDRSAWKPGDIFEVPCPECGRAVEFFKDDTKRTCGCGRRVDNPRIDHGCAAYCRHAETCFGELSPEIRAERRKLFRDRVCFEMTRLFGADAKRIRHAKRVAHFADAIGRAEGADMAVALAAGYLHDIGIHEAERKHGSTAARFQELEGPAIARDILVRLEAPPAVVDEVCDIVAHHHHPREMETLNFQVLYDADLIVNLEEEVGVMAADRLETILAKSFFTEAGRTAARETLLAA